jgi:hypothetical protein
LKATLPGKTISSVGFSAAQAAEAMPMLAVSYFIVKKSIRRAENGIIFGNSDIFKMISHALTTNFLREPGGFAIH